MPVPPPPPPISGAPPSGGAQQDDRGQLLKSIRAGATLRKTATVDRSAPAIAGRVRDDRSNSVGSGGGGGGGGGASGRPVGGAPNLGGLFSAGMPKLKATGLRSNVAEQEPSITPTPTASVKRGPPPVPPPATQKPSSPEQTRAPKSFGKPTLAPKPPPPPPSSSSSSSLARATQKPSPPPKKLNLVGGASCVSRAQSMRLPRSPPVLAHATPSSLHQSQDCLNETAAQYRPLGINRALRPPVARPPSPPIPRTTREPPPPPAVRLAPPPPPPPPSRLAVVTAPSMPPPPPPPPYRSTSMHQRLAPPPPPTPPMRLASANAPAILARNGVATLANLDLEVRFADKFHSIVNFPNPSPFRGFPKVYNSKNAAKQQAPGPPSSSAPGTILGSNDSSGGLNSGEATRRLRPLEN